MTDTPPQLLGTQAVYRGRTFAVDIDEVTLPNGRTVTMEIVRHRGSVVLLAMPAPDRIVLVRQYRYAAARWLWELPAGGLEPGEAAEAAAAQECHEEVGRIPGRIDRLGTFLPSPGFCDETMTFFRLTELRDPSPADAPAVRDADEVLEVQEFTVAEARRMVRDGAILDLKTAFGLTLV